MRLHSVPDADPAAPTGGAEGATVVVLVLLGDLDVRTTAELRAAVRRALGDLARGATLVLDLAGVSSADATALKVLAAASREARRDGVRVVLRAPGGAVRRMLHLTRLIRLIELERGVAEAAEPQPRSA